MANELTPEELGSSGKMKKFVLCTFLLLLGHSHYGQQLPLFSQYVFDPYLYNPAYLARQDQSEINLIHRRQWVDIQNAPVITGINAQLPLTNRMAVGLNIINDESVLLNRTSSVVSFSYKVPLSSEHNIRFGLSAGALYNSLDLDGVETISDPALANAQENNFSIDGQFGIMYSWKKLTLGFSLPRIFDTDPNATDNFSDIKFAELNNQILMASYEIELSPYFNLQPFLQYRFTQDNLDLFEAAAVVSYRELVKLGGFYRENSGPGLLLQLSASDRFDIGYAHEFATDQDLSFAGATHEFQLKFRFGKKKNTLANDSRKKARTAPYEQEKPQEETEQEESLGQQDDEEIEERNTDLIPEQSRNRRYDIETIEESPSAVEDMTQGYYLVVGSFKIEENARRYYNEIQQTHPESQLGYDEVTDFYFIYLKKVSKTESSVDAIQEIRKNTPFQDAWFKKIN